MAKIAKNLCEPRKVPRVTRLRVKGCQTVKLKSEIPKSKIRTEPKASSAEPNPKSDLSGIEFLLFLDTFVSKNQKNGTFQEN